MMIKAKKVMYFTKEVEENIVLYNSSKSPLERNQIYNSNIRAALDKLAENIIRTFKFYYTDGESYEDVKHNTVTFMLEKLPNYTQGKGKAFSYFSIVAKNHLIHQNTKNYRKLVKKAYVADSDSILDNLVDSHDEETASILKFVDEFINYWDINIEACFSRKQDQVVVDSIVQLFRSKENIELFNKKAIYIYVREMSNVSTQQITRIVKVLKSKYKDMRKDYTRLGYIPTTKIY